MNITEAISAIKSADNLDKLLSALQAATALPAEHSDMIDMSSLPLFGGDEPRSTIGIWSWDTTRLLVGEGFRDFRIVSRAEYAD